MDLVDLQPQLDLLEESIDHLEEVIRPLLKTALSDTATNLPLLDKAKLYVLVVYSIESLLFSVLKLNDVDAKNHPVFRELTRVKQYYEKIAEAEKPIESQKVTLNKDAATRVVKHSLAGNEGYDHQRAEQEKLAKEATRVKLDDLSKKRKPEDGNNSKDLHHQKTKASRSERKKRRKEKKEQVVEAAKDVEERSDMI